ncbi:hypothetical protein N3114_05810 [Aliarcobacter butzleri]|uniref:hypothetical protein n=1 Tax=Aliarcobacter butzleri TaxID=28197 RepID=UPI0021B41F81|nr:hypothetical protein [Aliarcobacter butzleri]UXC30534.1 hypothetical protein N3114_05810 [Aliarcobacter butzleri]
MNKKILLKIAALLTILGVAAFAGTGGSEVNSWYSDITDALKGTWGKIIAVAFLGLTIILFKSGSILGGIFMMLVGLGVGTIPDIVDAKYTALMFEANTISMVDTLQNTMNNLIHSIQ